MKIRFIAAVIAAFFMLPFFSVTAFAGGGDCYDYTEPEPATEETAIPATEGPAAEAEENPFTPTGTGTVIDAATDADGKEFYTIITPAENVFYLVIDRQRETENVYFLNAVTEADLLALAVMPEKVPEPAPVEQAPAPAPEPEPEPEPEKGGGMGMILLVRRYTDAKGLTQRMVTELIDHIDVYHSEKTSGQTTQKIKIYYNCIGAFDVPDRESIPELEVYIRTRKGVALSYSQTQRAG